MTPAGGRIEVVPLSLDRPFEDLPLDGACSHALLVVKLGRTVLGEVPVRARGVLETEAQRRAVAAALGEDVARERLAREFLVAARGAVPSDRAPEPAVSVVIRARDRAEELSRCLHSRARLETPAYQTLVLDRPLRGAVEEATGDLVALIDCDCVVDPGWLEDLAATFADPLVAAVVGYVGPLEIDAGSRRARRIHEGNVSRVRRRVFSDPAAAALDAQRLGDGNVLIRRSALSRLAPGADAGRASFEVFFRILSAGHKVVLDPSRVVWRGEGQDRAALETARLRWRALATRRRRTVPPEPLVEAGGGPLPERDSAEVPAVSVVVPSRDRRSSLSRVLQAIADQSHPRRKLEVIVALDGSTDGSAELVRSLEPPYRLRCLELERRGMAAAMNRGVEAASEGIVLFLDDDLSPQPGLVAAHARAHARDAADQVVLGYHPPVIADPSLWALTLRAWWADHFRRKAEPRHLWTYVDVGIGNSSFPRALLVEMGGFDEELPRGEDYDLGIRLLERGVPLTYVPAAEGRHHMQTSLSASLAKSRAEGRSDCLLAERHPRMRLQLPLGGIARTPDGRVDRARLPLAYRRPRLVRAALPAAPVAIGLLERTGLPRLSMRIANRLVGEAYALGLRDACASLDRLDELARGPQAGEAVPVALERGDGPPEIPEGTAPRDLSIRLAGAELARVTALGPGEQWDWERVTERVVDAALDPFRRAAGDLPDRAE